MIRGVGMVMFAALLVASCQTQPEQKTVADKNYEVNYWEMHKGTCEAVLSNPCGIAKDELLRCTQLWEMYRETNELGLELRSLYAKGFSQLYHTTEGYDQYVALAALSRVGIRPHPMGANSCVEEQVPTDLNFSADPFGTSVDVMGQAGGEADPNALSPELQLIIESRGTVKTKPSKSKKKSKIAKKANSKGLKEHKKKKYGAAIKKYEEALDAVPHYVYAKYNMACAYSLLGDAEASLMHLEEMYTWDDPLVDQQLKKARIDPDFIPVRDDIRFKVMTGYIRLILMNGAGEAGLPTIERLKGELVSRNFTITREGDDKNPRLKPIIFYKAMYAEQAEEIKAIVGSRDTQMKKITWDTLDDLIVVWGEAAAADLFSGDAGGAPIVQGERAEGDGGSGNPLDAAEELKGAAGDTADQATGLGEGLPGE